MVATSDFSGFESSDCAFASAAPSAAIDSLDGCMGGLRLKDVEADRPVFRTAGPNAMTRPFPGIFGEQCLQLRLCAPLFDMGLSRTHEHAGELGPAVRRTHIDHPDGLDPGPRRFDPK